ncbi:MAG: hypothetical protein HQ483_07755 [Rhodospirillales bacterium]|nr:hypothetical protein [Rhodospirillales bacterium]
MVGKFLTAFLLGVVLLLPQAGAAQENGPPPAPAEAASGLDMGRLLAIGAGVVVGSVIMESLGVGRLPVFVGSVAGGLIGRWWYISALERPTINQAQFREASVPANSSHLLKMRPPAGQQAAAGLAYR